MSHVTRVHESCHTCERACHLYEWAMSHIWMPHVTQVNESCDTCEWVMSRMSKTALKVASVGHARISHVTRINQSFYTKLKLSLQWWRYEYDFLNRSSHTWNLFIHNSNRQACAVEVLATCLCFLHSAQSAPACRSRVFCKVCCSVLQRVTEYYAKCVALQHTLHNTLQWQEQTIAMHWNTGFVQQTLPNRKNALKIVQAKVYRCSYHGSYEFYGLGFRVWVYAEWEVRSRRPFFILCNYCATMETQKRENEVIHVQYTASHCNTLQHTATHCNIQQHTATHCKTLQHTAAHCKTLPHTAAHCSTLQHTYRSLLQKSTMKKTIFCKRDP